MGQGQGLVSEWSDGSYPRSRPHVVTGPQLFELLQGWSPECFDFLILPRWQPGILAASSVTAGRRERICLREKKISIGQFIIFAILAMGNESEHHDLRLAGWQAGRRCHRIRGANGEGIAVGKLVESRAVNREGPGESLLGLDDVVWCNLEIVLGRVFGSQWRDGRGQRLAFDGSLLRDR